MHQPIDDHFLLKYRALLDAEDLAFDELEHACEEGDRMQFDKDMVDWQVALEHKLAFLANEGSSSRCPSWADPAAPGSLGGPRDRHSQRNGHPRVLARTASGDQDGAMPKSSEKGHHGRVEANGILTPREEIRGISAPSSRVNVAFPFSQIKLQEPSKEMVELAALVHDMVGRHERVGARRPARGAPPRAQALHESLR